MFWRCFSHFRFMRFIRCIIPYTPYTPDICICHVEFVSMYSFTELCVCFVPSARIPFPFCSYWCRHVCHSVWLKTRSRSRSSQFIFDKVAARQGYLQCVRIRTLHIHTRIRQMKAICKKSTRFEANGKLYNQITAHTESFATWIMDSWNKRWFWRLTDW